MEVEISNIYTLFPQIFFRTQIFIFYSKFFVIILNINLLFKELLMYVKNRNAFTMLELIFVVVIIGILSAIAIPKFAVNRDDAMIVKAKSLVGAVRSALATERQKRILRGNFTPIFKLADTATLGNEIFNAFDGNTTLPVLGYAPVSCATATSQGCWRETTTGTVGTPVSVYTYNMPVTGSVDFTLSNNLFTCPITVVSAIKIRDCKRLTQ